MKTIEVNLIGDLKQKNISTKELPLPKILSSGTEKPEEAKKNMILYITGGTAILGIVIVLLISLVCFLIMLGINYKIDQTSNEIDDKKIELAHATKFRAKLTKEKHSLELKKTVKDYLLTQTIPLGELMEELRAKVPKDIMLIGIKKEKDFVQIDGSVSPMVEEYMKPISLFILEINTKKPKISILKEANLKAVVNEKGMLTFAVLATIPLNDSTENKNNNMQNKK